MNVIASFRTKLNWWRYKRSCRRLQRERSERKRLEQEYEPGEMSLNEALYELARATVVGLQLKVWP